MELLNKIGISFKANYLVQGNIEEKGKMAKKANISNIEVEVKEDKKNIDIGKISKFYDGNIIFNIPTVNYNLSNLREVDGILHKLLTHNVKTVIIKASNIKMEDYEWSTDEEKNTYFNNIAKAVADLASNKVEIAIENTTNYDNASGYFGQTINQISDILVYSRKILMADHGFSESDANKYIKICFNVGNLLKSANQEEIDKWFNVFNTNIACIKIKDNDSMQIVLDKALKNYTEYKLNSILFLEEKIDLEEIPPRYNVFIELVNNYLVSNNLITSNNSTKKVNQEGYTNIVIAGIIVVTIFIAILMVYVKFHS